MAFFFKLINWLSIYFFNCLILIFMILLHLFFDNWISQFIPQAFHSATAVSQINSHLINFDFYFSLLLYFLPETCSTGLTILAYLSNLFTSFFPFKFDNWVVLIQIIWVFYVFSLFLRTYNWSIIGFYIPFFYTFIFKY